MKAIFAGTFDPFTIGHRDIVERAAKLFDCVIVAVAEDTGKVTAPLDERTEIAKVATKDIANVKVESFCGLLTDYAKRQGDCVLIRGVRGSADLDYERDLTRVYKSLGDIESLIIISSAEHSHVSSTVVRTIAALGGDISEFVVNCSVQKIAKIYGPRDR
ncbi:MAG: pantetheine-phosphate adenylyltransferase [Clostridiales bacterium]|nr:pantetheine-phosphate adenylyltransferase [Clostridiales bacterium]